MPLVPACFRMQRLQTQWIHFRAAHPSKSLTSGQDEASESSSESDSEESSTSSDEDDVGGLDAVAAPRQWDPDTTMYQNRKSKIVHVVASGGAASFSCGIQITSDYQEITESAFLDIRRCRRCATARPIKTVGQMASALKKLRQRG